MKNLLIIILIAAIWAVPVYAEDTKPHTLAVMGDAIIQLPPDYADVDLGVITQGKTVGEALAENSTKMTRVIQAVRDVGVPDKDIQTAGFDIEPKYEKRTPGDYDPDAFRPIIGYAIVNHAMVKVEDTSKIAKVIDASVDAGANAAANISFHLRKPAEQMDKAREAAVENALHKAQVYAKAAHLTLGDALSVTDNEANPSYNTHMENYGVAENVIVTGSRAQVPISTGEISLRVAVTVVYVVR